METFKQFLLLVLIARWCMSIKVHIFWNREFHVWRSKISKKEDFKYSFSKTLVFTGFLQKKPTYSLKNFPVIHDKTLYIRQNSLSLEVPYLQGPKKNLLRFF